MRYLFCCTADGGWCGWWMICGQMAVSLRVEVVGGGGDGRGSGGSSRFPLSCVMTSSRIYERERRARGDRRGVGGPMIRGSCNEGIVQRRGEPFRQGGRHKSLSRTLWNPGRNLYKYFLLHRRGFTCNLGRIIAAFSEMLNSPTVDRRRRKTGPKDPEEDATSMVLLLISASCCGAMLVGCFFLLRSRTGQSIQTRAL